MEISIQVTRNMDMGELEGKNVNRHIADQSIPGLVPNVGTVAVKA